MKFSIKKRSIVLRILVPLVLVMALQAVIFGGSILFGGTINRLNQNSYEILGERVINRMNFIENEMIQRWSPLEPFDENINEIAQKLLQEQKKTYADFLPDAEITNELLGQISSLLIDLMRRNSVTGAFVVLHGEEDSQPTQSSQMKAGLYFRDTDPLFTAADLSDILIERGSSEISKQLGVALDIYWQPVFSLRETDSFYYNPFHAAAQYPEVQSTRDLGYWCPSMRLHKNDIEVITYAQPLLDSTGEAYGVFGVEISLDYLRKQLPYNELNSEKEACYLLAVGEKSAQESLSQNYLSVVPSGPAYTRLFGNAREVSAAASDLYADTYTVGHPQEKVYANLQFLELYNSNTPFADDLWVLMGMEPEESLLYFSGKVRQNVLTVSVIILLIGIVASLIVGYSVARPVLSLARKVRGIDPSQPVSLGSVNIIEIDQLAQAIEQSSNEVAAAASKLGKILDMVNISIGAFEFYPDSGEVVCTSGCVRLMGIDVLEKGSTNESFTISKSELPPLILAAVETAIENEEAEKTLLMQLMGSDRITRNVRIKLVFNSPIYLGVLEDVTQQINERKKLEFERDYDLLTSLLNRRAFHVKVAQLFEQPENLKTAALLMIDLDNLKHINDTYGHDYGDEYISKAANVLRGMSSDQVIAARMSGDEFFVFLSGFESKDALRAAVESARENMLQTSLDLPDNTSVKTRASSGLAWYPDDAEDIVSLIKYADFAMYQVKHSVKGGYQEFDKELYAQDAFLLQSGEELNQLVEEQLVDYAFQPIVDIKTGEVFAFEGLMRPKSAHLKSPMDVLRIARAQSKLNEIERLTWFKCMEVYRDQPQWFDGAKIFVNSLSNQMLNERDLELFKKLYAENLSSMIIEITEEDQLDEKCLAAKQRFAQETGALIALDDYGSGYNGNLRLLELSPHFVKIDMRIIRGIDQDKDRQDLYKSLYTYSAQRGIKVIAEGVETKEEMQTLVRLGADYLQGYYFGKPELEPQKPKQDVIDTLLAATQGKNA